MINERQQGLRGPPHQGMSHVCRRDAASGAENAHGDTSKGRTNKISHQISSFIVGAQSENLAPPIFPDYIGYVL
jgi:hypothetical protein